MSTFDVLSANLTSVPVLAFALGILAARLSADLKIPRGAYEFISMTLLLSIGLKGGVALSETSVAALSIPLLITLALGSLIPILAYVSLKSIKKLNNIDRGSLAAHYGSTSLVTFTTALVFMEATGIFYEKYVSAMLVVMEIPGILIGILLATGGMAALKNKHLIYEVVFGKTVVLLTGALLIGLIAGKSGFDKVAPFFVELQPGLLTLFLLTLGVVAGQKLGEFKTLGVPLGIFALVFPLFAGSLGVLAATPIGMSAGGATAFAVLCASASYIAAPAAVSIALPKANPSLSIVTALGVTFPFNLTIGLPLYLAMAQQLN